MGRIATIVFAHRLGTSLEPECKMYRLAADVFNDTAMVLDCLSPALPKALRVILLSCSSVLRALCGVAAGSSKASLSAHFAKWGNLGELNAVSPPFSLPRRAAWSRRGMSTISRWGDDPRGCFLQVAFRISTHGQTEGLEPRNRNFANGVRTFRNHCVHISETKPSEQGWEGDLCASKCAHVSEILHDME